MKKRERLKPSDPEWSTHHHPPTHIRDVRFFPQTSLDRLLESEVDEWEDRS